MPATPRTAAEMPPRVGPRIIPSSLTLLTYETPLTAYSRGMIWASKAETAGRSNPLATPAMKITARIHAKLTTPDAVTTASVAAHRVATMLVTTMIERRSSRSAKWPPKSMSDSAGMASTSPRVPSANGSPVRT